MGKKASKCDSGRYLTPQSGVNWSGALDSLERRCSGQQRSNHKSLWHSKALAAQVKFLQRVVAQLLDRNTPKVDD